MQGYVDDGRIPCALTMIAREGRLVHFEKFGMQDIAAAKPVEFDTIFRLYSMTKPITSVAVMMLYEEGRFQLSTPVSEFVPAFKDMKVYTEDGSTIVDAEREVTIKHLLYLSMKAIGMITRLISDMKMRISTVATSQT